MAGEKEFAFIEAIVLSERYRPLIIPPEDLTNLSLEAIYVNGVQYHRYHSIAKTGR